MKRFPEHQLNAKVRRTRDVTALSRLALLLFCGLILAGGFVFAARQHFAAVQYGYQNESLRLERKQLLEENQRLALDKERMTAPDKLEPAARRLGLRPARPGQISSLETGLASLRFGGDQTTSRKDAKAQRKNSEAYDAGRSRNPLTRDEKKDVR